MERSSLCSKLKQQSINNNNSSTRTMRQMYDYKVNKGSSWDFSNEHNHSANWKEGDLVAAGFSWPPRSYTCTFCKREFRSAQALGGHMNVHRRDRARLRMSPARDNIGGANYKTTSAGQFSLVNINLDPNPNLNSNPNSSPNFFPSSPPPNFSSLFTKFPQFSSTLPPISPFTSNATETKRWDDKMKGSKGLFGVEKFGSSRVEKRCEVLKNAEFVRLDLEIGLISQSEELDLELRLGYT